MQFKSMNSVKRFLLPYFFKIYIYSKTSLGPNVYIALPKITLNGTDFTTYYLTQQTQLDDCGAICSAISNCTVFVIEDYAPFSCKIPKRAGYSFADMRFSFPTTTVFMPGNKIYRYIYTYTYSP